MIPLYTHDSPTVCWWSQYQRRMVHVGITCNIGKIYQFTLSVSFLSLLPVKILHLYFPRMYYSHADTIIRHTVLHLQQTFQIIISDNNQTWWYTACARYPSDIISSCLWNRFSCWRSFVLNTLRNSSWIFIISRLFAILYRFSMLINILHQIRLHLWRILCIHNLIHRRHLMVKSINGICCLAQTFCHMLRHIPFIFILQECSIVAQKFAAIADYLSLRLQLLWPFDRIHCIINNQMITSVTTLFTCFR